jgi:predicted DNA-binding antitoxin AbrB/MazE fold protein
MKTPFTLSALAVLLLASSSPCFGMMSIGYVSKERANKLGMELRVGAAGPESVWVELEFKTEGVFKHFNRVDLHPGEGKKISVIASLQKKRAKPGHVLGRFSSDRDHLEKISLWVVTGARSDVGHILRMTDFVDLDNLGNKGPDEKEAPVPRQVGPASAASSASGSATKPPQK